MIYDSYLNFSRFLWFMIVIVTSPDAQRRFKNGAWAETKKVCGDESLAGCTCQCGTSPPPFRAAQSPWRDLMENAVEDSRLNHSLVPLVRLKNPCRCYKSTDFTASRQGRLVRPQAASNVDLPILASTMAACRRAIELWGAPRFSKAYTVQWVYD